MLVLNAEETGTCGDVDSNAFGCPYLSLGKIFNHDPGLFRRADTEEIVASQTGNKTVVTKEFNKFGVVRVHYHIASLPAELLIDQRKMSEVITESNLVTELILRSSLSKMIEPVAQIRESSFIKVGELVKCFSHPFAADVTQYRSHDEIQLAFFVFIQRLFIRSHI